MYNLNLLLHTKVYINNLECGIVYKIDNDNDIIYIKFNNGDIGKVEKASDLIKFNN